MIVIYGCYRSRATRNIWLLEEIGHPWRLERVVQHYRVAASARENGIVHTRSAAFLARFPAGTIPVMQDGDVWLSESLAINHYVTRNYGGAFAHHSDAEDATSMQWTLFGATSVEPSALALSVLSQAATPDATEIDAHERRLDRPLRVLETVLERGDWLVGDRFGVADINMAEILRFAASRPDMLSRFPATAAWLAKCQGRPAFQRMWALRSSEPAEIAARTS
ncbi:glutathione S-transferase family protein [Rhodobacteraceae bacterium CCMM004]|nr:glutathione S-transferase family protein [Rhodobacteraceae bacterium CCMM004]